MSEEAWTRWFAWHPVRLKTGKRAWFRYVERNFLYAFVCDNDVLHKYWEYR